MKQKITLTAGLFLVLCLFGCSDFLTVDVPDSLTKKEYWKSRDHAKASLVGVYTTLGNNIPNFICWGGLRSEIYGLRSGIYPYSQFVDQDIRITNSLCDWGEVYRGINRANSFLKNVHLVLDNDRSFTVGEMNAMMGQVYALRALNYFYLVRTFRDVPYHTEPYESDTQSPYAAAVPEETVLDSIESDLSRALAMVPDGFDRPNENYGYVTKNAVMALWADVKLWRKKYEECIDLCERIEKKYRGQTVAADSWFSMFSIGNARESIFEYQYLDDGPASGVGNLFYGIVTANRSAYYYNVRKVYPPVFGGSETTDTIRPQRTVQRVDDFDGVFKYLGIFASNGQFVQRDQTGRNKVNFIFYRYREVLLMKAEALGALGRYEEAVEPVNEIRTATGMVTVTPDEMGSGENFMDRIICEHRTELAYEGKDWFILLRIARNTGYTDLLIDRIGEHSSSSIKEQTLKAYLANPESWFLPYYDSEVQNNLLLTQKDFYKGKK